MKKIFGVVAILVITLVVSLKSLQNDVNVSALVLSNAEALAGGEVIIGTICASEPYNCCYYPPCCGSSDNDLWVDNAKPI